MRPLFENVLVAIDEQETTESGLEMTGQVMLTGTVIDVGDGTPEWPKMVCRKGDRVRWTRNAGHKIDYNGLNCIILNERRGDIIARL